MINSSNFYLNKRQIIKYPIITDKATQNKIFCVHGGIGSTAIKIEELDKIKRPCEINLGEI